MDEHTGNIPIPPHQNDHAGAETPQPVFHRSTRHITQEPIDDVEPEYVTRQRYQTLEEARSRRVHMGTASNDADYLPAAHGAARSGSALPRQLKEKTGPKGPRKLHYERYLETPKPGKSIFTSRRERGQRRAHLIIGIIALLAAILAVVWFFFLR